MTLGKKYGEVAYNAIGKLRNIEVSNKKVIISTWKEECKQLGMTCSIQDKTCPRTSFIELCEAGLIKDLKVNYLRDEAYSIRYAIEAVNILKTNSKKVDEKMLWKEVMKKVGKDISSNYQMDVVLNLWKKGMIVE